MEMGGSYTTGVARVVGELSRQKFGHHEVFLYSTNVSNERAKALCSYDNQYMGYVKRPFRLFLHMLMHPFSTFQACQTYRKTDTTSFLHMEFIRDNFSRVIDLIQPDIIHHHGTALPALYYANLRNRIPVVYSPHGLIWLNNDGGDAEYEWMLNATKIILSFANTYTALNESVMKRLQLLGVDKEKVSIIPNGVDTKKYYYSDSAREALRNAMGVKRGTLVFITVGLIIDRKGQFDFLKILQKLGIDYQYWIIGKGPDYEPIKQYTIEKDIQDRVKLFGYIEDKDIYQYHSAADIYVHGSTQEAQALSEIEANACGLRIIVNEMVSDTVIGDIENDSYTYFSLDFNHARESDLLQWLFSNPQKRVANTKYDWAMISQKYADCYEWTKKEIKKD